jgi:O-antigen/teichoic acid export membrane protein
VRGLTSPDGRRLPGPVEARVPASGLRGHVLAVGGGLAVSGLGTYVFLALAGQRLSVDDFATFSVAWSLLLTVSAGLFVPLEMETSRRHSLDPESDHVTWALRWGLALTTGVAVAELVLWGPLMDLLDDEPLIALSIVLLCLANCLLMPLRGRAAAAGRFGVYSGSLVVETLARVGAAAAAFAIGADSPATLALALPIAAVVGWAPLARRAGRRAARVGEIAPAPGRRAVAGLVVGSLLAQVLLNLPPIVIKAATDGTAVAGQVLAGLSLARIPLFLSPALIAPLLPRLVALHRTGAHRQIARLIGALVGSLAGLAVVGAVVALVAGGPVTRLIFGPKLELPGDQVAVLVVGAVAFLAALITSSALVAVGRHGTVAAGWAAGLVALGIAFASVESAVTGGEWGLAAGGATATAVFAAVLLRGSSSAGGAARGGTGPWLGAG